MVRALKDKAVRLTAAGRLHKALEAWEQLAELEPGEPQNLVRSAEIRRKLGDDATSVQLYLRAAEAFGRLGFASRAQAALTLAAKMAPTAVDVAVVRARLQQPRVTPPPSRAIRTVSIEMEIVEDPLPEVSIEWELDSEPGRQVRRIGVSTVAVPNGNGWVLLTSEAPIHVEHVNALPELGDSVDVLCASSPEQRASLPS